MLLVSSMIFSVTISFTSTKRVSRWASPGSMSKNVLEKYVCSVTILSCSLDTCFATCVVWASFYRSILICAAISWLTISSFGRLPLCVSLHQSRLISSMCWWSKEASLVASIRPVEWYTEIAFLILWLHASNSCMSQFSKRSTQRCIASSPGTHERKIW